MPPEISFTPAFMQGQNGGETFACANGRQNFFF
jgi:hypothetical protein